MSGKEEIETTIAGAQERAASLRETVKRRRATAIEAGVDDAIKIGALEERVSADVDALAEMLRGLMAIDANNASEDTSEVDRLRMRLASLRNGLAGLVEIAADGEPDTQPSRGITIVVNVRGDGGADLDADKIGSAVRGALDAEINGSPVDPADARQLVVPGSLDVAPATPTSGARREEQETAIETWTPEDRYYAAIERDHGFEREWAEDKLLRFREANKGKTARRWGTSFTAYLKAERERERREAEAT